MIHVVPAGLDHLVELTLRLADEADAISIERFRAADLSILHKADNSPVTDADTRVEAMIREVLAHERPDDAVVGEEAEATGEINAEWRWVIDPIDGTKSYARGNENWATLIALQHHRQTMVAVASMPAQGHRFVAVRGDGAERDGARLRVSDVSGLADATLAHTSVHGFTYSELQDDLIRLAAACADSRGFGNSVSHLSVARGTADIGWTSWAHEWDFAALALIVEEAGGRFTDLAGEPALGRCSAISTNGHLHDATLAFLRSRP